jgi:Sigma-70 region 2
MIEMKYINTDDSEKYDIRYVVHTESLLRDSTARFICNPIVDDAEAGPDPKEEYQPPSCLVVGGPSVNDLATHRWHNDGLDAESEAQLIQRIKDGLSTRPPKSNPRRDDERAFRHLLEAFHRTVVDPASRYTPRGSFYGRQSKNQKHTNDLLYEDLTSEGCFALWQSVLKFDLSKGHRFSALSRHKIVGAISNEANYLRQKGYTSGDTVDRYLKKEVGRRTQSRLDRWIFSNLRARPEELLEAQKKLIKRSVFHSLEDAADALKRASNLEHPDVYSDGGDDDIGRNCENDSHTRATEPKAFRDVYQSQDPLYWSPQLGPHRNKVNPIVDFWIRELCDPPRIKAKPQPKPVYKPCGVKPTGRVLHPIIDNPYWMEPRERAPDILERKPPYDPDRREAAVIRFKGGKTKRVYRQIRTGAVRRIEVTPELNAKYAGMIEQKGRSRNKNVRPEPKQAPGGPVAEIVVLESRRGGKPRLHVSERHMSSCAGERSASAGIAGQ